MATQLNNNLNFDYIIIGSGVAGFHIAMQMQSDKFFENKSIAIFDKHTKNTNDKTLCYWEKGNGKWDNCVSNTWSTTYFKNKNNDLKIALAPYSYKKINAIDFYNYCKTTLQNSNSFSFFTEEIINVKETKSGVSITTNQNKTYKAKHVFDSRLEISIDTIKKEATYINQSFRGWVIKATKPVFDNATFTMMDYSHSWQNSTSFMYILPKSKTEALLEYTFFAPFTIDTNDFDNQISTYIRKNFTGLKYEITEIEEGQIPMTNYNFKKHHSSKITKIGTAGGWVKASTGYSFKFAEKNAIAIIKQLKSNKKPIGLNNCRRFAFYDKLLLKILAYENNIGANIFYKIYKHTHPKLLFSFLDEETNIYQEIKLISKLPYLPFIKAIFRK